MTSGEPLNEDQVARQAEYWLDLADYDMATARTMQAGGHFLYVGFMCHQVVEKGLKGLYVISKQATPPYIHALVKLAKLTNSYDVLSPEAQALLDTLEPLYRACLKVWHFPSRHLLTPGFVAISSFVSSR